MHIRYSDINALGRDLGLVIHTVPFNIINWAISVARDQKICIAAFYEHCTSAMKTNMSLDLLGVTRYNGKLVHAPSGNRNIAHSPLNYPM